MQLYSFPLVSAQLLTHHMPYASVIFLLRRCIGLLSGSMSFVKKFLILDHMFLLNPLNLLITHIGIPFFGFVFFMGYIPVPASSDTICLYAAFLARSLKFNSIKSYLNIIGLLHKAFQLNECLLTREKEGMTLEFSMPWFSFRNIRRNIT